MKASAASDWTTYRSPRVKACARLAFAARHRWQLPASRDRRVGSQWCLRGGGAGGGARSCALAREGAKGSNEVLEHEGAEDAAENEVLTLGDASDPLVQQAADGAARLSLSFRESHVVTIESNYEPLTLTAE